MFEIWQNCRTFSDEFITNYLMNLMLIKISKSIWDQEYIENFLNCIVQWLTFFIPLCVNFLL